MNVFSFLINENEYKIIVTEMGGWRALAYQGMRIVAKSETRETPGEATAEIVQTLVNTNQE